MALQLKPHSFTLRPPFRHVSGTDLHAEPPLYVDGWLNLSGADGQCAYILDNADLSTGDIDWMVGGVAVFDTFATTQVLYSRLTSAGVGALDLRYNQPNNRMEVRIWSGGVILDTATIPGPFVIGVPYTVFAWLDSVNDLLGIEINAAGAVTGGTGPTPVDTTARTTLGGYEDNVNTLDGKLWRWAFWKRVLTSAERISIYNSGAHKKHSELTTAQKVNLKAFWDIAGDGTDAQDDNDLSLNPASGSTAPTYTTNAYALTGQITPKSMSAAYEETGLTLERPHKVMADSGEVARFTVGTRLDWGTRRFAVVSPARLHNIGNAADHCSAMLRELEYAA